MRLTKSDLIHYAIAGVLMQGGIIIGYPASGGLVASVFLVASSYVERWLHS